MSKNAFHGGHLLLSDQYGMVSVMKDAVISGQDAFHLLAGDAILYFLLEILSARMWVFLIFLLQTQLLLFFQLFPGRRKTLFYCLRVYRKMRIPWLVPFVCHILCALFVYVTLFPKQQLISGRYNQNSAGFHLSSRNFYICPYIRLISHYTLP